MSKLDLIVEAQKRGILPESKKPIYEEAVRRGLIQSDAVEPPQMTDIPSHTPNDGMLSSHQSESVLSPVEQKLFGGVLDTPEIRARQGQPLTGTNLDTVEMVSNIPDQAVKIGKGIYDTGKAVFDDPKGTGTALYNQTGKLLRGTARNLGFDVGSDEDEETADAFGQYVIERLGSADDFKKYLNKEPLETGSLVALGGTGVQGVTKGGQLFSKAVGATNTAEKLGNVSKAAGAFANTVEPVNALAKGTAGVVAKLVPETLPENLYLSATKMTTGKKLTTADRKRLARFAVEQGIQPTEKGIATAFERINEINSRVQRVIDDLGDSGQFIVTDDVLKSLDDVRSDILSTYIDPKKYLTTIDKLEDRIRSAQGRNLTPRQAQDFKSGIYREIQEMYQPGKSNITSTSNAEKMGKKSLARALKNELERLYPELKDMNATEGEFLKLIDAIEPAVKRIANRDKVGIGVPMKTGAGEIMGQAVGIPAVGGFLGFMQGVLDAPLVKSRLAIVLDKARSKGVSVPGATPRNLTYQAGEALPQE